MTQFVACEGIWSVNADSALVCTGTLTVVPYSPSGMSTEDAVELGYSAMGLFAVIFGFLALKKALS